MAYVEEYYGKWNDYGGTTHEVKLLLNGGSGPTVQIEKLQPTPCTITKRGQKDSQIKKQIYGRELTFNFVVASADIAGFDAIFESEFKDWKVEKYYNSALEFTAWLQPDNYRRNWIKEHDYYLISLTATDGLATLKNIEFVDFNGGAQYSDRVNLITTIQRALEHIELSLDFRVQLGTNCTNDSLMTSTECTYDKATVDNSRYTKTKDGREINEDGYTIIEKINAPFNCYLIQSDGLYWILNPQEIDSYYFPIPWSTLTVGSRTANDLVVDLSSYDYHRDTDLQKIRPLETVEVTYRDRNVQDNLLSNGDFSSASTSEWTAHAAFSTFDTPAYGADYELRAKIDIDTYGAPGSTPEFHLASAEAITVRGTSDKLKVTYKLRCALIDMDAAYMGPTGYEVIGVTCQIRKGTATGSIISSVSGGAATIGNDNTTYVTYTHYFPISDSDDYFVQFVVDEVGGGAVWTDYDSVDIRLDDIYFTVVYSDGSDITFDKWYGVNNTDSVFTDKTETELYFGDSSQDNDIGSFQISGTRTETWDRYGKTEDGKIQVLYAQNILENYSSYKNYGRVTIIDPNHNISSHSILLIDSKYYQTVDETIIYATGQRKEIKCQLVEVLNSAVNSSISIQTLTSIDGESTESSSSSTGSSGSGGAIDDGTTSSSTTWSSTKIVNYVPLDLQDVTDNGASTDNSIIISGSANDEIGILLQNSNSGSNASAVIQLVSDGGTTRILRTSDANSTYSADDFVIHEGGGGDMIFSLNTSGTFAEKARIHASGNVSIGNTSDSYKLYVTGTSRFTQDSVFDADVTANSYATSNVDIEVGGSYIIDATGTISATDFRATSDISQKTDLKNIDNALELIDNLHGYYFKWIPTKKDDLGLIAQMVKKVLPQVVDVNEAGKHNLNYNSFIALLIEGIKELKKIVLNLFKKHEKRFFDLEERIKKLEDDTSG